MLLMTVVSSDVIVTHPQNCLQRNDTFDTSYFCIVLKHLIPHSSSELNNNVIRLFNTLTITEYAYLESCLNVDT